MSDNSAALKVHRAPAGNVTRVKVADLIGPALDWAVAVAKLGSSANPSDIIEWATLNHPSTNRDVGVQIIEDEGINLRALRRPGHVLDGQWLAAYDHGNTGTMVQWVKRADWHRHYWSGPTPLVAAMRCYAGTELCEEIDIPEGLWP